jgi:hypothetical protein
VTESKEPTARSPEDKQLAEELVERAREEGGAGRPRWVVEENTG